MDISHLIKKEIFTSIDVHFANFLTRLSNKPNKDLFLAAALVSNATGSGHVCLDLNNAAEIFSKQNADHPLDASSPPQPVRSDNLLKTPVVGRPGDFCPLILDPQGRLYLYRYWHHESTLAHAILKRAAAPAESIHIDLLKKRLLRFFPDIGKTSGVNWQAVAAAMAVIKRFCVISGGPGTGKTFTIAAILALLLEQELVRPGRIFLCAPTGKASAKLKESILKAKSRLDCAESIKAAIPEETYTIHRLLKTIPGSPFFQHTADNPLPADLVMVDEASMVDLALMSRLFEALAPDCRVVLIGDKDQLASVEAGSVLGDICNRDMQKPYSNKFAQSLSAAAGILIDQRCTSADNAPGLQDCITTLQKSYRFDDQSGIGALGRAVNAGESDAAVNLFQRPEAGAQIFWQKAETEKEVHRFLEQRAIDGYAAYLKADHPFEALEKFARFRILCTLNKGPYGVEAVNHLVEGALRRKNLIDSELPWYRGRPVLVSENDYQLGLFNGDIGILMAGSGSDSHETYVFFPEDSEQTRRFMPQSIRGMETAYAMTVHKCQGSEFDHVLFVVPDQAHAVLTRELIYTGATRARKTVTLLGPETVFRTAVKRVIKRTSGLRDALWGKPA